MDLKRLTRGEKFLLIKNLNVTLHRLRDEVIEMIMDDYSMMLNGVDTDSESKIKPEYYQYRFADRLEEFEYITETEKGLRFTTPDHTDIDLSDLEVLELIFEGISGKYVTVTEKQFKAAGLKVGSLKPVDSHTRRQDWIYLVRFNSAARRRIEKVLKKGKHLPVYAFSNASSVDIFETADRFVKDNMDKLVKKSIKTSLDQFKNKVRGI